jgi:O-antigen ligase
MHYLSGTGFILLLTLTGAVVLGIFAGTGNWIFALGFLCIPLVLKWPVEIGLGVFAFFLPFDSIAVLGDQSNIVTVEWLAGAAGTLILLATAWGGGRLRRPPRVLLAWWVFMLWLCATGIWAIDPRAVIHRLPTVGALLLLYTAAVTIRITRKELLTVVMFTALGGVAAAAYSTYGYYYQGMTYHAQLEGENTMRASLAAGGHETDPNDFAASLLLPVSLCAGAFLDLARKRTRHLALLGLLVLLFSILLTMSRGALLALAALGFVYLRHFRVKKSRILIPLALGLVLLLAMPELFFTRVQQAAATGGAGRLDIWVVGWHGLQQHWLLGAGLDNFAILYNQFAGLAPRFVGYNRVAHNIYLSVAVEGGIFALLMFFYVLKKELLDNTRKLTRQSQYPLIACEAGCWGLLVAGFFLNLLFTKAYWFAWILLEMTTQVCSTPLQRFEHRITSNPSLFP